MDTVKYVFNTVKLLRHLLLSSSYFFFLHKCDMDGDVWFLLKQADVQQPVQRPSSSKTRIVIVLFHFSCINREEWLL